MSAAEATPSDLVALFVAAKAAEEAATAARIAAGERLAAALGGAPVEGSRTHTLPSGIKITLRGVMNRRVDWEAFWRACAQFPGHHPPSRTKAELDVRGLEWIRDNEPAFYAALAKAITATPGRTGIEIK